MKKEASKKGGFGILIAGVAIMGGLLGWIAYADEISNDLANIATAIQTATNKTLSLDPNAAKLITQVRETVEAIHNGAITQDLFGAPTNANGVALPDAILTNHFTNYCSLLEGAGALCTLDPLLMYGDMKISSLLSGTSYDAPRQQAAQVFLSNLMDPPATTGVTNFNANMPINVATLANGSPQTKAAFVQALSDEAMVSIMREPFANMIAIRTPQPASDSNPAGPSQMEMMEATVMQRFMNSEWAANLNLPTTTPQQIAVQQAMMQAFQMWLSYQQYRQMERIEALLSITALQSFRQQKAAAAQINQAQNAAASSTTTSGN